MGATCQFPDLRVVDVNLKECRSLFTAANQILFQIAGVNEPPVSGLDGVFEKLWAAVEDTKYLVLILDEIDAIFQDRRYKPSDFLYRLVRRREMQKPPLVGLVTNTNVLMGIDSLLDSRVRSSVGTQSVYFPPYQEREMAAILRRRLGAFKSHAVAYDAVSECAALAASEHGDAGRALDLLRTAGELADRAGSEMVEMEHVDRASGILDSERARRVILGLPAQEVVVLMALNYLQWDGQEETVTTEALYAKYLEECGFWGRPASGTRRFLDFLQDLEMHGLIGLRVESSGRQGRGLRVSSKALSPGPRIPCLSAPDGGYLSPCFDPELTSSCTVRNEIHIHVRGSVGRAWRRPARRGLGARPTLSPMP